MFARCFIYFYIRSALKSMFKSNSRTHLVLIDRLGRANARMTSLPVIARAVLSSNDSIDIFATWPGNHSKGEI